MSLTLNLKPDAQLLKDFLIPCTAKYNLKRIDVLTDILQNAYNLNLWPTFAIRHQEHELEKAMKLAERDIIDPEDSFFDGKAGPGRWVFYHFAGEPKHIRGNFLDTVKIGIHKNKILSLDQDPLAQSMLLTPVGEKFFLPCANHVLIGIVDDVPSYNDSKKLLRKCTHYN